MIFNDLALARRLERVEGRANADFVDARALASPESGAAWIDVEGTLAMFDGIESPLTQTFGLGLSGPVTGAAFDRLEQFFTERQAPTFHEVSPLADPTLWPLLNERRYHVVEFTSVVWRPIERDLRLAAVNPRLAVRPIQDTEHELSARIAAEGWNHLPALTPFLIDLARVNPHRRQHVAFLAELDGEPVAAGSLALVDGVALLAGASTIPRARRQGAQLALLEARLRYAAAAGCDIAMMGAAPGSDSQRNAERQGFRIAYTRVKWQRATAP
jgi:hypothetical protein